MCPGSQINEEFGAVPHMTFMSNRIGIKGKVFLAVTLAIMVLLHLRVGINAWPTPRLLFYYGDGSLGVFALGLALGGVVLLGVGVCALFSSRVTLGWAVIIAQAEMLYAAIAMYFWAYALSALGQDRGHESMLPFLDPSRW
jgi:hypothetical protein